MQMSDIFSSALSIEHDAGSMRALSEASRLRAEIVSYESANKGLSSIRAKVTKGNPVVMTRGGREADFKNATILFAVEELALLVVSAYERGRQDHADHESVGSILSRLAPIDHDFGAMSVGRRKHDDVVGGHAVLRID